jgi:hypothetical protein
MNGMVKRTTFVVGIAVDGFLRILNLPELCLRLILVRLLSQPLFEMLL